MPKRAFVTVTDQNRVNQNAVKIMLKSFLPFFEGFDSISVLYPNGQLPSELISWLKKSSISTFSFDLEPNDDPYATKFLLIDFLDLHGTKFDEILYLDPDHIVLRKPKLKAIDNSLIVSSEVKKLDKEVVSKLDLCSSIPNKTMDHCNTSLIYGKTKY